MATPPAVACSSAFDAEPSITAVLGELVPRRLSTSLYQTVSEYKPLFTVLGYFETQKIPIKSIFSVGNYNITINPALHFLYEANSTIQLIQRQNVILSWFCKHWRNYPTLGDLLCGCPAGEAVVDNTGEVLCVLHPCSSIDWNKGWCAVDVDPLKPSCVHSYGLAHSDVSFEAKSKTPLLVTRVLLAFVFLFCASGVVMTSFATSLGLLTFHFMNDAMSSPGDAAMVVIQYVQYLQRFADSIRDGLCPSEYCAVTLLTFFGGLFFRDEVPRRVDQSTMIVLTGYTFRAVGITLVLYSVADAPSMAALSAILVFAAIFRLRAANNSTNEQLQQSAYGGIKTYETVLKRNTELALSKLRTDLDSSRNLFDRSFSLLSVAGKPKLAHLLKCFKDGSFSGIPYVAAADISSTTRKSWVYIVSAIALMVLVMTVCAIYCVLASSEGYGALWLGGKAPPF